MTDRIDTEKERKLLIWDNLDAGCQRSDTEFGTYTAWTDGCLKRPKGYNLYFEGGIEAAKFAAQADYDTRILAAPQPSETSVQLIATRDGDIRAVMRFGNEPCSISEVVDLLRDWQAIDPNRMISFLADPDLKSTLTVALDALDAKDAEIERMRAALKECQEEIDQYIWQEYPADHPVNDRYRQRDLSANPARVALNPEDYK